MMASMFLLLLSLACLCQAKNLTLVLLKDAAEQASILATVEQNCEVQFCVHAAGTVCIAPTSLGPFSNTN